MKLAQEWKTLIAPLGSLPQKATWIVAIGLALQIVFVTQGNRIFFIEHLAKFFFVEKTIEDLEWFSTLYQFGATFLLFFVVPLALFKTMTNTKLSELGLGLGDWKLGISITMLGIFLIALPGAFFASHMPEFLEEYPLAKSATDSVEKFVLYQLAYGLLYYVAWESFFRGFLQRGLQGSLGDLGAVFFQTACSTLLHIGKPAGEVWAALFAGFLFGLIVLRTRTVWPLILIHWGLGCFTDLFCALRLGSFS